MKAETSRPNIFVELDSGAFVFPWVDCPQKIGMIRAPTDSDGWE